jgi:hypothetical protein
MALKQFGRYLREHSGEIIGGAAALDGGVQIHNGDVYRGAVELLLASALLHNSYMSWKREKMSNGTKDHPE